ncbi:MAG TPA: DNA repair protein RecN [Candidatus Eisenbacteria bacterium]|uniref:DNA repair protein RecN n=1 Tax=Eiseniibacteriota bacterium TaxID=2212470 RepID=A0A7V2AVV2_UNCEI|nr:DNA repair protein RecN [Candidatus Eisenbacteria bacterium]
MLEQLKIRNLAVVEDAVIEFTDGLNVLTGSTGAGKSIILTAVELLSGSRAKKSLIRRGAGSLLVEGIFRVPPGLGEVRDMLGMEAADDLLSVQREFDASGRSRIRINGAVSTGINARTVTSALIELHGQHGQQELLDPSRHVRFLDLTGGYGDLLGECRGKSASFREAWKRHRKLLEAQDENRKREEFLRFQLRELDALGLEPGLAAELERRVRLQGNFQRYSSALEAAAESLAGEGGAIETAGRARKYIASIADLDERWQRASGEIASALISLKETARELESGRDMEGEEEESLEHLQERLSAIQRTARKYGTDADGLVQERERIRDVLRSLDEGSDEIEGARDALRKAKAQLLPVLDKLSAARKKAAAGLDADVTAELAELGMKGALFVTAVGEREIRAFTEGGDELDLSDGGRDDVEFMIRTNVGEDLHPLADIASGGELSRLTLVLKKLLVRERRIPTLIFDEIDTGLGADMGSVVAGKLSGLSERYQVICITHLPQVAAVAVQHISVEKAVSGGRTRTRASVLSGAQRTAEIARMLGGNGELREKLAEKLLDAGKSARSSAG